MSRNYVVLVVLLLGVSIGSVKSSNPQDLGYDTKPSRDSYLCPSEYNEDDACTDEHYFGFLLKCNKMARFCDKQLTDKKIGIKNMMSCVRLARSNVTECELYEPHLYTECKGCQCLSLCLMQGLGIASSSGVVNDRVLTQIAKILEVRNPSFKDFHKYYNVCKDLTGDNLCERSYKIIKCIIESNTDSGFETTFNIISDILTSQTRCDSMKCNTY